jgi:D-alanyl-D-alanine carboxypeptidase
MSRKYAVILIFALSGALLSDTVQAQDRALDAILRDYTDTDGPAIAIEVTTPDGHWEAARGRVDVRSNTLASPQDRFRIGSMSKTFVATVALQLVSEGVFSLDDRAADWLPPNVVQRVANADRVTLRELMSMRSGIPDYLSTNRFWAKVDENPTHDWAASEALPFIFDRRPMFQPGRRFYYSNTNYILMQLVLESATGQPLHELVRQRILDPLGLQNTYSQGRETLPGGFVHGRTHLFDRRSHYVLPRAAARQNAP